MNLSSSFAAELEKIAAATPSRMQPTRMWTPPTPSAPRAAASAATGAAPSAARRSVREGTEAIARGAAKNLGANPIAALVGGLTAAGLMTMTQRRDARQDKLLRGLKAIETSELDRRKRNRLIKTVAVAGLAAGISGAGAPVLYRKATSAGGQLLEDTTKKFREALVEDITTGVETGAYRTWPQREAGLRSAVGEAVQTGIDTSKAEGMAENIGKEVHKGVSGAIGGPAVPAAIKAINEGGLMNWLRKGAPGVARGG